jgi:hypothetical protein
MPLPGSPGVCGVDEDGEEVGESARMEEINDIEGIKLTFGLRNR